MNPTCLNPGIVIQFPWGIKSRFDPEGIKSFLNHRCGWVGAKKNNASSLRILFAYRVSEMWELLLLLLQQRLSLSTCCSGTDCETDNVVGTQTVASDIVPHSRPMLQTSPYVCMEQGLLWPSPCLGLIGKELETFMPLGAGAIVCKFLFGLCLEEL